MTIREAKNVVESNGYKIVEAYRDDRRANRSDIKELVVFIQRCLYKIDYLSDKGKISEEDVLDQMDEAFKYFNKGLKNFGLSYEDIMEIDELANKQEDAEKIISKIMKALSY